MKNVGPVRFSLETAAAATAAASRGESIYVAHEIWARTLRRTPPIGSALWVQEPCVLYEQKKTGLSEIVFGGILTARVPNGWRLDRVRKHVDNGSGMLMRQSRYTLEVLDVLPDGLLRCAVHPENITKFMQRVPA